MLSILIHPRLCRKRVPAHSRINSLLNSTVCDNECVMLREGKARECRNETAIAREQDRRPRLLMPRVASLCRCLCQLVALTVLIVVPRATSAEPTAANGQSPGPSIVVNLAYKELTNGYVNVSSATADSLSEAPKLRLETEKHDLGRYSVRFKDAPPMAMVWDRTSNVLYLDLNRNLDLTDDPAGVITNEFPTTSYGSFRNVRITVPTKEAEQPFLVDLNLFPSVGSRLHLSIQVRSFWQGKATIDGTDHEIGIIDEPAEKTGALMLLLRSWEQRDQPLNLSDGDANTFLLQDELFFRGHLHAWTHRFDTNISPAGRRLELKETPAELGEIAITGKHIDRIVMTSQKRTVVLERPASVERVPVGNYMIDKVRLRAGERRAAMSRRQQALVNSETVKVQPVGQATLIAGGPLTNSVSIVRRGKTLVFNYELRGQGGMEYRLINDRGIVQPEFAVYQGDRKVASGKFEFG